MTVVRRAFLRTLLTLGRGQVGPQCVTSGILRQKSKRTEKSRREIYLEHVRLEQVRVAELRTVMGVSFWWAR